MIIIGIMRDMEDRLPGLCSVDCFGLVLVFRLDLYDLVKGCSDENGCHVEVYTMDYNIAHHNNPLFFLFFSARHFFTKIRQRI